jgi:EAL domain-containing protein (putative c-di-GMP-specific phosphodiesterase class I)
MCRLPNIKHPVIELSLIRLILQNKTINTEYQPIVSLEDDRIMAYEALARFSIDAKFVPPDQVFEVCHKDLALFYHLEMAVKKHQFQNRPNAKKLFINFDPHILHYKKNTKEVFDEMSQQNNFVIELVENSHTSINIQKLIDVFSKLNYQFAVDDFFKENSIISLYLLKECHFLKLDKDILRQLKIDNAFVEVVKGICNYAHRVGKEVILEGIETEDDLYLARECRVDFVQGFLYRERFVFA